MIYSMDGQTGRGSKSALAQCMKAIGYLTSPTTATGKVFTTLEKKVTGAMDKLAQNDVYLNFAGRLMDRSFRAQSQAIRAKEEALRSMRMPTASDVDDLRAELRRLNDQVEATSAQMEVIIEALEKLTRQSKVKVAASSAEP
jgi:hypothetical protein